MNVCDKNKRGEQGLLNAPQLKAVSRSCRHPTHKHTHTLHSHMFSPPDLPPPPPPSLHMQVTTGRRVVPTELGIALIRGYQLIDPELCRPQVCVGCVERGGGGGVQEDK